jgi:hypothetical protein
MYLKDDKAADFLISDYNNRNLFKRFDVFDCYISFL